jgi:hypothetical protein
MIERIIDRFISIISPALAIRRLQARRQLRQLQQAEPAERVIIHGESWPGWLDGRAHRGIGARRDGKAGRRP